ncbi:MAG: hypothetical protein Q8922_03235 [Bacteroidota bacterium]|nr:hypothetical protein [Bacteroidota bacterium]MDP4232979.1 hypothetical protein [Bacteroidota bacterium]MDP4242023.1 hypothetical protein [Bacteroidota bacterium]MDP4286926.1 hypothetical protein [Bacteroidota bacterium]
MNYPEIIHHYLAGDATHDQEEQLFTGLADHPEWREELQLQLKIHEAAQRDLPSLTVPPAARSAIFSRLGFNQTSGIMHLGAMRLFGLPLPAMAGVGLLVLGAGAYLAFTSIAFKSEGQPAQSIPSPMQSVTPAQAMQPSPPIENGSQSQVQGASKTSAIAAEPRSTSNAKVQEDPSLGRLAPRGPEIPNEPVTSYVDPGKFSSVSYLTPEKIIGVADAGKIFCSENGGKTWVLQTSMTQADLSGVHFIDLAAGVAVGAHGTILLTSDEGREWKTIPSMTTANLATVRYVTRDTLYACGEKGTLLRSTNGGAAWTLLKTGTTANLFRMRFENGSIGEVHGEGGISLMTQDAGATWKLIK